MGRHHAVQAVRDDAGGETQVQAGLYPEVIDMLLYLDEHSIA